MSTGTNSRRFLSLAMAMKCVTISFYYFTAPSQPVRCVVKTFSYVHMLHLSPHRSHLETFGSNTKVTKAGGRPTIVRVSPYGEATGFVRDQRSSQFPFLFLFVPVCTREHFVYASKSFATTRVILLLRFSFLDLLLLLPYILYFFGREKQYKKKRKR